MKFELFIALRYLREKRKQTMISVISILSVAGIAAGVMALVIALALSTGFKEDIQKKILGATPAVNLFRIDGAPVADPDALLGRIGRVDGVTASAPAILRQVLVSSAYSNQGAALKGVDPAREAAVSDFFARIVGGDLHVLDRPPASPGDPGPPPPDRILIGREMARTLQVGVGDTLRVFNPLGRLTPFGMTVSEKTVRVAGVFDSGLWDIDANWAYIHIDAARRLFAHPARSALLLQFGIADLDAAEAMADAIRARAGGDYATSTWIELNRPLFSALKLEKIVLFITIGLIVFVASLNIVTTLIMMVLEKQRDIAILAAMGATADNIRRVFRFQGLIIGVAGTALGSMLGVLTSWTLDHFQLIRLEAAIYSIPYVPFHVRAWDVVLVSATAILISLLATIYPSRSASKMDPVEALRYE
ncbi:MAG: ABC transporter permease [Acidobacteriota bacterium]|jgi:lipoprotein-releasing system permease protein|nr:ABC transporter permease [Acidobacteriota bacterium]NLT33474.1 ABC transporter permease [Acidobacteriota bacterium]